MASFSVTNITSTSADIRIVPDSDYLYYRVFVRLADDTSDVTFDEVYELSSTDSVEVTGLSPETEYAVNVGYNNTGAAHVEGWILSTAETFWTEAEAGESTDTECVAKIYVDGEWVDAVPYIYSGGWKKATPNIF